MKRQVIVFRLAAKEFALPIESTSEVLKGMVISRVPQLPSHIAGVIPYRDEILPVVDLKLRLGLGVENANNILVVHLKGGSFGILVDAVLGLSEVQPSEIVRKPDAPSYVYGSVGTTLLLDLPALFGQGKNLSLVAREHHG
jgi:purine-binding chemotaxis protein CheW